MEKSSEIGYTSTIVDDQPLYMKDGIIAVSADGEPHEVLTMIAGGSGLIVAIIVLCILVILIDRSKSNSTHNNQRRKSIFTIFNHRKSFDITVNAEKQCPDVMIDIYPNFTSTNILPKITTISC